MSTDKFMNIFQSKDYTQIIRYMKPSVYCSSLTGPIYLKPDLRKQGQM